MYNQELKETKKESIIKFFMEEEIEEENRRLYRLLNETIKDISYLNECLYVEFSPLIFLILNYIDDEYFTLFISDPTLYEYKENNFTKMSKDRILHYLEYIANLVGSKHV